MVLEGELGGDFTFEPNRGRSIVAPDVVGPDFPSRVENNDGSDLDDVKVPTGVELCTDESELVDDAGEDPLEMGVP